MTNSTLRYSKGVVVGMCALWSEAIPSQNRRKRVKVEKNRWGKQFVIA